MPAISDLDIWINFGLKDCLYSKTRTQSMIRLLQDIVDIHIVDRIGQDFYPL